MKRRNLLVTIAMIPATLAMATILAACDQGGDSSGSQNNAPQSVPNPVPSPTPNPTPGSGQACLNGGQSTVLAGGNPSHSHPSTTIPAADVASGATHQYDVPAENGHTHTFTLQPPQFAMLRSRGTATLSTNPDSNGHFHAVTIVCQ